MFIRKKQNKSGTVSVQLIHKDNGQYKVVQTIGSSSDPSIIEKLLYEAQQTKNLFLGNQSLEFNKLEEDKLVDLFYNGIEKIELVGPELLLGKLFDEIGFGVIKEELFRHLVITRLCFPVSKLKTADYLYKYKGVIIDVERIYRYLDKLHSRQKEIVQQISYTHTCRVLNTSIRVVFYDVTTLYFETDTQDEIRKTGFSKDGKHKNPQIVLGLLVSVDGYPLAYEIFEGNTYEGYTMLPVIEKFRSKYNLDKLVVVADAGLLSNQNIIELESHGYEYILGARIKNEKDCIKRQILNLHLSNGESSELYKDETTRIIISYSDKRAKKDLENRKKGILKLEESIKKGKLTKSSINNRGYNKFLRLEGEVRISIDYDKLELSSQWDGLKGYITNTKLTRDEIIEQYGNLWKIEKAFRIAKSDLRIRPIYHRLKHRIEAHISIAFCACKIYKELERQLKENKSNWSPEQAIEIANTIYKLTIIKPYSKEIESRLILKNPEQEMLLKLFKLI